jgi:hypothetical protein
MPTKLTDWQCSSCNHVWEYLCHKEDQHPIECPNCESIQIEPTTVGSAFVTRCHDPAAKKEILMKRSADHSRRLVQSQAGHRGSLPPNFGRHHVEK